MKLAEVYFDWTPVIPGADKRGEGIVFPLRTESTFRAVDGWSIERLPNGDVRLHRDGMPAPVVVTDGYSFVEAPVVVETRSLEDVVEMNAAALGASNNAAVMQARASQRRRK